MAVVAAVYANIGPPNPPRIMASWQLVRVTWSPLANGDTGAWEPLGYLTDKTVQVFGTFGAGGSVTFQGSNDTGTTAFSCNDVRGPGNPITLTSANGVQVLEEAGHNRPTVTAGDGTTALTVVVVGRVPMA